MTPAMYRGGSGEPQDNKIVMIIHSEWSNCAICEFYLNKDVIGLIF